MLNEKYLLVTHIFFLPEKSIVTIKGLDPKYKPDSLEFPLYLNEIFIKNISFISEYFLENKSLHIDERAFECKQHLDELKDIDLTSNFLQLHIG